MRSHPLAGIFCLALGGLLLVAGALGRGSPGPLARLPLPPDVIIPFILWQLAIWSLLFGFFFLRPRGRYVQKPQRSWNPLRLIGLGHAPASREHASTGRP